MKPVNSERIIWTDNALNELAELLDGGPEIDLEEMVITEGIDFPWPITIKSIKGSTDTSGQFWVNVILSFTDIPDATGYEVRFSPYEVNPVAAYTFVPTNTFFDTSEMIFEFNPTDPQNTDFVVMMSHVSRNITSITGGYSNWSSIYVTGAMCVWIGYGTSLGTPVTITTDWHPTDTGLCGVVFRDVETSTPSLLDVVATSGSAGASGGIATPSIVASPGDIIVSILQAGGGGNPGDPTTWLGNNNEGLGVREFITGVYRNGMGMYAGYGTGSPVYADMSIETTVGCGYNIVTLAIRL